MVELKTARTANPDWFRRDALRMAYHAQLAWYADGLRAARLADVHHAFVVAVESAPPFPVVVFELTPEALEHGRKLCRLWLEQLLVCEQSDHWPGYAQSVVPLDVDIDLDDLILSGINDTEPAGAA